jgi:DNA-directed RNA polymerase subunit L
LAQQSGFSPEFLNTIYNLINYYILRQQLVMLAMVDVNPRALSSQVLGFDIKPYIQIHREKLREKSKKILSDASFKEDKPETIWKNDWEYFAHGNGCRLTHLQTGERIEWDGPNPKVFDIHWFLYHLDWRLINETTDPYVKACNEWFDGQKADLDIIQKSIYWLVDEGKLRLRQDGRCYVGNKSQTESNIIDDLKEVIQAFQDLMEDYHDRQDIAVQAMVELRPDFIIEAAENPFTLPETAQNLKILYRHLDSKPKRGSNIQSGQWNEIWEYDIRYGSCSLVNISTREPIRWSISDPNNIDYHGFVNHLQWRLETDTENNNILSILQWINDQDFGISPSANQSALISTGLHRLWNVLIENHIISFQGNKKGNIIKLIPSSDSRQSIQ